jgi:agmatinase
MNFLGLDHKYESSKFCILPVGYGKSQWRADLDKGPSQLLMASRQLEPYIPQLGTDPSEAGIHTAIGVPTWTLSKVSDITNHVVRLSDGWVKDGKIPVTIGGAHAISPYVVSAMYPTRSNMTVVVLDAHVGLRGKGEECSTVSRMRQIPGLSRDVIVAGVRSYSQEDMALAQSKSYITSILTMDYLRQFPLSGILSNWANEIIKRAKHDDIYLSLDLDVLDMSIMPAVVKPEPDGLLWKEIVWLIRSLAKAKNIVGFDVCNLCPLGGSNANGTTDAYELLAARLVYEIIGAITKSDR